MGCRGRGDDNDRPKSSPTLQHACVESARGAYREATDSAFQGILRRLDDEMNVITLDRIMGNPERLALGVADAALDFIVERREPQTRQLCDAPERDVHGDPGATSRGLHVRNVRSALFHRPSSVGPQAAASERLCAVERERPSPIAVRVMSFVLRRSIRERSNRGSAHVAFWIA